MFGPVDRVFHKAHLVIAKERNIRIHHECEGGIDKSVPPITIWHLSIWESGGSVVECLT